MGESDSDETICDELENIAKIQAKENVNNRPLYSLQNVQRFVETCDAEIASYLKRNKPFDKAKLEFIRQQLLGFAEYDLDYNLKLKINGQLNTLSQLIESFENLFFKESVEDDIKAVKDLDGKSKGENCCYRNFWDSLDVVFGTDLLTNQKFIHDNAKENKSRKRTTSQRVNGIEDAVTTEIGAARKTGFTFEPQLNPEKGILTKKIESPFILKKKPRKEVKFSDQISYNDGDFPADTKIFGEEFAGSDIIVIDPKEPVAALAEASGINNNVKILLDEFGNFDDFDEEIDVINDSTKMQPMVVKSKDFLKDSKSILKMIDDFYNRFEIESKGLQEKYRSDNVDGINTILNTKVNGNSTFFLKNDSNDLSDTEFSI